MYDVFLNFCFPLFYTLDYHYHPNTKTKIKTKDRNDQQHKKKCIVGAACLLGKELSVRLRVMSVSFTDSQVKEAKKGGDKF